MCRCYIISGIHNQLTRPPKTDESTKIAEAESEKWKIGSVRDRRKVKEEMYGGERLIKQFRELGEKSAEDIKKGILQSMEGYKRSDDVSLVVLKRIS